MSDPVFLSVEQIKFLHRLALDRDGGQEGVRDAATLEKAMIAIAERRLGKPGLAALLRRLCGVT